MVKKIVTGLAISVGAGLALAVTTRTTGRREGWHPAKNDGTLTPVTIRVHSAVPRTEEIRLEPAIDIQPAPAVTVSEASLHRSAELAELKVVIETLDQRSNDLMATVNQRIDDLQNHLPRFIDVKVTSRIREVEDRLRSEFQDEQSRTLDAFLKTLDHKVLPRIAVVEETLGNQGVEIAQMRQRIEKTDETLGRVLLRIEKVVDSMVPPFPGYANSHVTEIHQKAVA